jgi:predicted nucleic acid-binding protein
MGGPLLAAGPIPWPGGCHLGEAESLQRADRYQRLSICGNSLVARAELTILRATKDDEAAALNLLVKFVDQSIGFVDCLSFALMRRHRIPTAFSFDRHFESAGFPLVN